MLEQLLLTLKVLENCLNLTLEKVKAHHTHGDTTKRFWLVPSSR